ncbi:MAG: cadherin repeat domain-containing protein [Cyanobacteria bacterium CRU_2_1]|nr:cadherin repeat domain-containing protein [Cyanobacteria bacterium RU_5_0]NJR58828.1 cadherin repeat domain-containing protein [Cyanobacteria bacterium CRU_2_1]
MRQFGYAALSGLMAIVTLPSFACANETISTPITPVEMAQSSQADPGCRQTYETIGIYEEPNLMSPSIDVLQVAQTIRLQLIGDRTSVDGWARISQPIVGWVQAQYLTPPTPCDGLDNSSSEDLGSREQAILPDPQTPESAGTNPPEDLELRPTTLNDNAPANTLVGILSAIDPDSNETITYELVSGLGSQDNDSFTVTSDGQLRINGVTDYEASPSYSIRVRATDSGENSLDEIFIVTVNPPTTEETSFPRLEPSEEEPTPSPFQITTPQDTTAIAVTCQVLPEDGLNVFSEPTISRRTYVDTIPQGEYTFGFTRNTATTQTANGIRRWVYITAPVTGWITTGVAGEQTNVLGGSECG